MPKEDVILFFYYLEKKKVPHGSLGKSFTPKKTPGLCAAEYDRFTLEPEGTEI